MGVNKTFTKTATKVSGLSSAEKKIVKVTVNKSKKKVTVKGLKPGKASFKIGSKSYTVKVGAVAIKKKSFATSLKVGTNKKVTVTSSYGAKDTLKWSSSKTSVVKVSKATTTASAKKVGTNTLKPVKAGSATITVKSKNTGKSLKVKVTVKAATPATATPAATATATATGSATTTPSVAPTATATGSATTTPSVAPTATVSGGATTTPSAAPTATGGAIATPEATTAAAATATPTVEPTKTPEVATAGTITVNANVSGASIKVVSGTTVVATDSTTKVPNGTYTLIVTKEGYKEVSQLVTVNGDITVNVTLEKNDILEITGITALNTQENEVELSAVPATAKIKISFNKAVNKETVNVNNIRVFESEANIPVSIPNTAFTLSGDSKTVYVDLSSVVSSLEKGKNYKVVVKDVATDDKKVVSETSENFTIAKMAVVTDVEDASSSIKSTRNAATGTTKITVTYDEALNASTINTSNISLVDVKTGEKIAIKTSIQAGDTTNKKIDVELTNGTLTDGKQYIVSINGNLLTSVGDKVEAFDFAFAVNASLPLSGSTTYGTIDGKNIDTSSNKAWPNVQAGMKEQSAGTPDVYYAGLNIVVNSAVRLDAQSVKENVQLVEKEADIVVDANISYNADAQTISIVPNANLKEDTTYVIRYKGGLKTELGLYLDATKKDKVITANDYSFKTMDITAPVVTEIVSTDGLTDLKRETDHTFTVTLSEDPANLSNAVVVAKTSVKNDDSSTFAGNILTYNTDYTITKVAGKDNTYTIKILKDKLAHNQAYKIVVIGKDMKDTALAKNGSNAVLADSNDNRMTSTYTLAFTTEGADVTGPVVKAVYTGSKIDADNVVSGKAITNKVTGDKFTIEFNEKLHTSFIDASKVKLQNYASGKWNDDNSLNAALLPANASGEKYGLNVTLPSIIDAQYRIVVEKGAVKDVAGNELTEEYVFEFTGSYGDDVAPDITVGTLSSGTFSDGATGGEYKDVSVDGIILINFAENEIAEIPEKAIVVKDEDGNEIAGTLTEATTTDITGGYTIAAGHKCYKFAPSKSLDNGKRYTVTVEGVKDVYGNKIDKNQFQFTTAEAALKITSCTISDGDTAVDLQKTIKFTTNNDQAFSVDNDSSWATGEIRLYEKDNTSSTVTPTIKKDDKTISLQFTSANKLKENTKYVLDICLDAAAGADGIKSYNFTTGRVATDDVAASLANSSSLTIDSTPMTVDGKTIGVNLTDGDIVAVFDEEIKKDDVKVAITSISDTTSTASPLGITLDPSDSTNKTLKITTLGFKAGETYKVVISGVKDKAGNVTDNITFYVTFATGA